jgi:hypothetical protein
MKSAFKDWAIVVDALGRGEQILILRKGGISEGRGGFKVEHEEFLLFPTLYHQQGEQVVDSAAARYREIAGDFPPPETLRIEYAAKLQEWTEVLSLDHARRLAGQHIWKDEVISDRFEWGREQKIFALALRVLRLPSPVETPMLKDYGGCKSWIELAVEIPLDGAEPVLDDIAFDKKLNAFRTALNPQ